MIRFFIALWISKVVMFIFKLTGSERNDWPGLLAYKLCPDFLKYISKPPLVIAITGTNGKTTTSALIANKFMADDSESVSMTGEPTFRPAMGSI